MKKVCGGCGVDITSKFSIYVYKLRKFFCSAACLDRFIGKEKKETPTYRATHLPACLQINLPSQRVGKKLMTEKHQETEK